MIRLGVDAFNLARDTRGMGRYVRGALQDLREDREVDLVLIARDARSAAELPETFAFPAILPNAIEGRLDAVWYPWNGMRFAPCGKAVVTVYDPFAFTYAHANPIARWREQHPIKRAIRNADTILTISEWSARELKRLFALDSARLQVALPGLESFWHPVAPPQRAPYMLFLGASDRRKNAAMLLAAFERVFAGKSGPTLIAAGTLAQSDERTFARMRAPHERAAPSDRQLRALYSGALAVVVPSLAEGYGLPVIEAMACGAPVVASDASALPEAAGGAAILVPPNDTHAWSDALARVADDAQLRADLRARGLERAKQIDPHGPATALRASLRRLLADVR